MSEKITARFLMNAEGRLLPEYAGSGDNGTMGKLYFVPKGNRVRTTDLYYLNIFLHWKKAMQEQEENPDSTSVCYMALDAIQLELVSDGGSWALRTVDTDLSLGIGALVFDAESDMEPQIIRFSASDNILTRKRGKGLIKFCRVRDEDGVIRFEHKKLSTEDLLCKAFMLPGADTLAEQVTDPDPDSETAALLI